MIDIQQLHVGDIIQHDVTGDSYVVMSKDDDHVWAHRVLEISNPQEWKLIKGDNNHYDFQGKPLSEVTNVEWLRYAVQKLYNLLDNIDSADDMAKENNVAYRQIVQQQMIKRLEVVESDGWTLFVPNKCVNRTQKRPREKSE